MHKHTCLNCSAVIEEGDFDCELDRDHDTEVCEDCRTCAYCGRLVSAQAALDVPAVSDDDAWEQIAREHDSDCEWVATRAHRLMASLVGVSEIAQRLGWSRNKAADYHAKGYLPDPIARLRMGPVWRWEDVEQVAKERGWIE